MKTSDNAGNVLFLILIAVALFAALSYAVTKSTSGGGNADTEKNVLTSTEVVQYITSIKNSVMRLQISNGCDITQISFENPTSTYDYTNALAPADKSCHVFDTNGGGLSYKDADTKYIDTSLSGNSGYGMTVFTGAGIHGVGKNVGAPDNCDPDCAELLVWVPYLTKDLCVEINKQLGNPNYSGEPPQIGGDIHIADSSRFRGSNFTGSDDYETGAVAKSFSGLRTACIEGKPAIAGRYFLYSVLIER